MREKRHTYQDLHQQLNFLHVIHLSKLRSSSRKVMTQAVSGGLSCLLLIAEMAHILRPTQRAESLIERATESCK